MFGITWLDPQYLLEHAGGFALLAVCLIVFAETGLLAGFFLPGDSLLFLNGLLVASTAYPAPLWLTCVLISGAAWLGDQTGYWIGRLVGDKVFTRPNSKFFNHKNVERTHAFFERYGARAIILAHFVPVMRTFVPVAAGVGEMSLGKFLRYNIFGVIGWGTGMTLLGYFLGRIEYVKNHISLVTVAFIVLSFIPLVLEVIRARRASKK